MTRIRLVAPVLGALVVATGVLVAQQENVPGQQTLARVYVLNRERAEAVGVTIQDATVTLPVAVAGTATVALAPNAVVATRGTRQGWEYRQLSAVAGQDLVELLNKAGADGWEAVGWSGTGENRSLLMKRPR
jgi:hypothetical protein